MLSGLYPTPIQCNRNSLLDFIELWTMVRMSDSSLCLSPLLPPKRGKGGTFCVSSATGWDCSGGCWSLAWGLHSGMWELHEEGWPLSISSDREGGWQIWPMVWFQDANSFLGSTYWFLWRSLTICVQSNRAQYSVGMSRTCGRRTGLHLHLSGQIPWCCLPSRPGVAVPQGAGRDCCQLCSTHLDPMSRSRL